MEDSYSSKEYILQRLKEFGAVATGIAAAEKIPQEEMRDAEQWLSEGNNAGMDYLSRHLPLKGDLDNVLPGTRSVISLAFSFNPERVRDRSLPSIASYAYGDDYHDVIRRRLLPAAEEFAQRFGGEWRICIDSAPVAERYWAVKSGIGYIGRNGMVIVEGYGSMIFLAEILTTLPLPPDSPAMEKCRECGKCIAACPAGALGTDTLVDCRRCLSYLSIEHRGEWDEEMRRVMATPAGKTTLFGCDRCLTVCPHNRDITPTDIPEFRLRDSYSTLTAERAAQLSREEFSSLFRHSAIKRARYEGFIRNARNLTNNSEEK